ncbi:MAG: hypothetical protein IT305_01760 [Chloroflexi bacterium]|nr:hypothetical protein [Chloroflexota bacterium]
MTATIGIDQFIRAIERLPSDPPQRAPGVWFTTQKEHWLGWLRQYDGPGAYNRIPASQLPRPHDAKWVYNHVVNPYMLFWLVETAGVRPERVEAARNGLAADASLMARAGAIRRHVPWADIAAALWGNGEAPTAVR